MKINTKKLKYGTAAVVITVVVAALVVLLNIIVSSLSDRYNMSFDLTPGKNFEITEKTLDYLASLNEDVEICTTVDEHLFRTTENVYYRQAYEVLKKYEMNSDRIKVNFVDMTVDPTYVEKYKQYYSGSVSEMSIIIFNENSHRIRVISVNDLFNIETNYWSQSIVSSKAEQVLTSAVMYVTDPDPKTAVYLNVISDSTNGSNIIKLLTDNGFDVTTIDPNTEELPMDTDLIIVNSPLNDFSESFVDKLYEFMENGGQYGKNMIYLASNTQHDTPNINAFIAEWGISIGNGYVCESNRQYLFQTIPYALVAFLQSNDYTGGIPADTFTNPVAVYGARPLELLFESHGNVVAADLLKTSETGFVYTSEMEKEIQETGDVADLNEGQITVMALSYKYTFIDNEQIRSNMLVFGSDDMLGQIYTEQPYFNNGDYFVSAINTIFGKETGVYIVAKDLSSTTFERSESAANAIRIAFIFVLPALVAAAGIIVWLRRRHK
ncbi:MAG: GldG family protein [Oscillospiraceae bacterium]|nr:GldG family protein [Oscillospiraceae bacterium]